MNNDVFVIIPAYNEGKVIKGVLDDLIKVFPNVVCVDDGSNDNTAEEIKKTNAYLVQHPINMGQGAALQTGIDFTLNFANAKYLVTFDADGQHKVSNIKGMVHELKRSKYDIILGSRFLGSSPSINVTKKIILKAGILFSNFTSKVKLTDTHNGLRVFNRRVAECIEITMSDMAHASEILEIIRENNLKFKEFPVEIVYTDYSRSKGQSIINAVNIAFDVMLRRVSK